MRFYDHLLSDPQSIIGGLKPQEENGKPFEGRVSIHSHHFWLVISINKSCFFRPTIIYVVSQVIEKQLLIQRGLKIPSICSTQTYIPKGSPVELAGPPHPGLKWKGKPRAMMLLSFKVISIAPSWKVGSHGRTPGNRWKI